ncbi:antibiotic biosynthesis monooxygenase [Salipaludibacillus neizhouensis]|uniref:Antibiotic biosynthesis monooxygenase n=1 Tax=Salipaludibacillus neizhouensis TaxID=885475 RepID=A0A3A9K9P2_9BACI|nr:antibiotic biosynthesis monooxygenase [Salipaludibacillus neizhouensis]RKL66373.1 antibiotic biosynthesis monooxygenase [Salipaludibacillus neizhouensis]
MLISETKTIVVKQGTADKVVDRFSGEGIIEQSEGFIDLSVLVKESRKGNDKVVVLIRWESEASWKQWEKSEAHINMHRQNRGKPKPDHIVDSSHDTYHVRGVKTASAN